MRKVILDGTPGGLVTSVSGTYSAIDDLLLPAPQKLVEELNKAGLTEDFDYAVFVPTEREPLNDLFSLETALVVGVAISSHVAEWAVEKTFDHYFEKSFESALEYLENWTAEE